MRYRNLAFVVMLLGVLATLPVLAETQIIKEQLSDFRYEMLVYDHHISWYKASEICNNRGGYLADILSQQENDFLAGFLHLGNYVNWGSFPYKGVWMGFSDEQTEGIWVWSSGQPTNYTNFGSGSGEPNNGRSGNCGAIELSRAGNRDGWWNDASCSGAHNHDYPGALCKFSLSTCANVDITPTSQSHSSNAESGTVTINASPECSWTATSNTDWATITFGDSGEGNGTVTYSITANPNHKSRQGTLTIAGRTFTITQEGIDCSYSITPTSQSHSSNTETGSVIVRASVDCPWTASSNISWVNIVSGGSGNGDGTVTYGIMENTGTTREGTLTIAGQSFTITQAGKQSPHPTCSTTDDELVFTKLKEFYAVGEIVEVDLVACATSRFDRADLWVAIELPSEEVLFMTTNPFEPFSLTPQVFRKSVANTKANYHILQFEVPPDLGGKYTFYAVYVKDT